MKQLAIWVRVSLVNLAVVALLGLVLRGVAVFPSGAFNYAHWLHAHSHFAFGGWVTLALMSLMVYSLLPGQWAARRLYQWLLAGVLVSAYGMLGCFAWQGYAPGSIFFSTLLVLVSFVFTVVFIRDVRCARLSGAVKTLSVAAVVCLSASAAGPFMIAGLSAMKIQNQVWYNDAIYTYLHFQYNGFFTLAVFALLLHVYKVEGRWTKGVSVLLTASVWPSLFMCYLWHQPGRVAWFISALGAVLLLCAIAVLLPCIKSLLRNAAAPLTRHVTGLSIGAFILLSLMRVAIVVPAVGAMVFASRSLIIGFLHLVLLGFVSLAILAFYLHWGVLHGGLRMRMALSLFITGIVINELLLLGQPFTASFLPASYINRLLLFAAMLLFSGAVFIAFRALPIRVFTFRQVKGALHARQYINLKIQKHE